MRSSTILMFCLLFISLGKGMQDQLFLKSLPIEEVKDIIEHFKVAELTPSLTLVIFYSQKHCNECNPKEDIMREIYDRFRHMIKFSKFNCDKLRDKLNFGGVSQCKENYHENLPNAYAFVPKELTYYPYNPQEFNKSKEIEKSSNADNLDSLIYNYMPTFAKRISNIDDMNDFIDNFDDMNRTIYFSNEESPPSYFKGLSSYFKDRLEFAYVLPSAYEVHSYFSITKLPRWLVLKKESALKYSKRRYLGKRTFDDLRDYLGVFAEKQARDRKVMNRNSSINEKMSHLKHKLIKDDFNVHNIRINIDRPDEIILLHCRDMLSMDYPNLGALQKLFG